MKALTIKEPFASLIKEGTKVYETRSFKTNYRGEIYIHSSKSISTSTNAPKAFKYLKGDICPGCILVKCRLVDCIYMDKEFIDKINKTNEKDYGRYEVGRYAWKLEVIEVLKKPIPIKGKLGIWNIDL